MEETTTRQPRYRINQVEERTPRYGWRRTSRRAITIEPERPSYPEVVAARRITYKMSGLRTRELRAVHCPHRGGIGVIGRQGQSPAAVVRNARVCLPAQTGAGVGRAISPELARYNVQIAVTEASPERTGVHILGNAACSRPTRWGKPNASNGGYRHRQPTWPTS